MKVFRAKVIRKDNGNLVYGNEGPEKFKQQFEEDMEKFDDNTYDKIIEDVTLEITERENKSKQLKENLKSKVVSTEEKLLSLIEYLGLDV